MLALKFFYSLLPLRPDLFFLSFFPFFCLFSFLPFLFLHAVLYLRVIAWCPFLRAWHIATRNRQMSGYVFPSDPHTGLNTTLHSSHRGQGFGVAGTSQEPTYATRRELRLFLGSEHLAVASWQPFMYVFPSVPQTGRFCEGHFLGHGFKLEAGFLHAPETN